MGRLRRAAALGTIAAVDPRTGGQWMPRTVTTGRAQSMSETGATAQQRAAVDDARIAAELLGWIRLTRPGLRVVQPDGGLTCVVADIPGSLRAPAAR
jgi:secreted PhoX family phosphatase